MHLDQDTGDAQCSLTVNPYHLHNSFSNYSIFKRSKIICIQPQREEQKTVQLHSEGAN